MKQKTAMQDLKDDLIETIKTSKEALEDLQNKELAQEIHLYVEATLRMIIQRLDNELLLTEQNQIRNAHTNKCDFYSCEDKKENCVCGLKYYERTYTQSSE